MANLHLQTVVPANQMRGDDVEDTRLLGRMLVDAENYLLFHEWVTGISERYFGLGVGGVVAVFLFKIVPSRVEIDDWLWVIVGDLPSAYLVTDKSLTPASALQNYIAEMRRWVKAAEAGLPIDDVIPVNAEPSRENAQRLGGRLDFLTKEILPLYGQNA